MTEARDPSRSPTPTEAEFERLLADYIARIDESGRTALDTFRAHHPAFAARLGKQLEWLTEQLAEGRRGAPATIGPYRVRQRLGAGGMGEVFLAEQSEPFRRLVAVKVVKLGAGSASRLRRFAGEIQALALLNHDGIAKVFEAGGDAEQPYFTMEYVPGLPITAYCEEVNLDLRERLRLFVRVCRAVEHAHRHGILHRDLKPSNILVYGPRREPVVKIIDFGLAKAVQPAPDASGPTEAGQVVGTLDYMCPELVDDSPGQVVDTRVDVYALGVVLYQLLTGLLPLSIGELRKHGVPSIVRHIREDTPTSPSLRVAALAASGSTSPLPRRSPHPRLRRQLVGDLDHITMTALAKDRDRRYGSPAQLADDIERHLRHEPITARRHTAGYVLGRFARRHRVAVSFAATALAVTVVGLVALAFVQQERLRLQNEKNSLLEQSLHRLERGNLFGLATYVDVLHDRDANQPPAARREYLPALRGWLDEFETVLAQRDRMQTYIDTTPADGDAADAADWSSGSNADMALRDLLRNKLARLAAMTSPGREHDKMRQRIDWAERVEKMTVDDHRESWQRVRRELGADQRFQGLDLLPQVGLIPIGKGPAELQLFALPLPSTHLPRDDGGRCLVGPLTCPVFVLLPGNVVWLGAQKDKKNGQNFDPDAERFDVELQQVTIDPFFASICEFTVGQWHAVYPCEVASDWKGLEAAEPIADIDAAQMRQVVSAWGMRLPTPIEWEYLARAGTSTPRWCGSDLASLADAANVYDAALRAVATGEDEPLPSNDGFVEAAPVGSLRSNQFGIYDVLGNVFEVTDDPDTEHGRSPFDIRGGAWTTGPRFARASFRRGWDGSPKPSIGFRPVISIKR